MRPEGNKGKKKKKRIDLRGKYQESFYLELGKGKNVVTFQLPSQRAGGLSHISEKKSAKTPIVSETNVP